MSEAEELGRVEPVVAGLAGEATVSVDTSKAAVAEAAIDAGASIVNDVTALRGDPEMAALCAEHGVGVVLMHMPGDPRTMQDDPATRTWSTTSRRSWPSGLEAALPRESPRSGSGWTRGSGLARRSSTTWSCCAGWGSCGSWGGRW